VPAAAPTAKVCDGGLRTRCACPKKVDVGATRVGYGGGA
jgi:hypothetical protein